MRRGYMTVITTFVEKQREKRWKFERKVLKELSLKELRNHVREHFTPLFSFEHITYPYIMDPCIDTAIDAYLVGAEYSRFGYYGEEKIVVYERCYDELHEMVHYLYGLLEPWYRYGEVSLDSLSVAVSAFIEYWWERGFLEGQKRYRLRLH